MKQRSEFGNAVREATAILLLPLVAIAFSGPAFAAEAQTAAPAGAEPAASAAKPAVASPAPGMPETEKFAPDQLEQMVAPVALYPDSLLTQILMASTFPIQIVQAARWLEKHPGLKEKALEDALKPETWDASVKSICGFPDVLKKMNENLDWTQDMGEAFMAQRSEVLDAVQRMRGKAYESGNLKTTPQQTVTQQQDKIIVIQPSNPEVIYVPQYSSTVVYGSAWAYPTYYYPPAYYGWGYGAMAFTTAGFIWGAAMWGGCSWGWGHSDVDIDINRQNNFNGRTDAGFGNNRGDGNRGQGNRGNDKMGNKAGNKAGNKQSWNRNSGGASNKSSKYGGRGGTGVSNNQARGYGSRSSAATGGASASTRGGAGTGSGSRGSSSRPSASPSTRGSGGAGSFGSSSGRGSSSYSGSRGSSGSSAWSGSRGGPSSTRSSSSRGSMSRGGGGGRGGGRR